MTWRGPMKRIRLTIEWPGACSEVDWARVLTETIEKGDYTRMTRVARAELLTDYGETRVLDAEEIRAFGGRPPPEKRRRWWWTILGR